MTDRNEKTRWQDVAGFLLILLGGFGAVSIVLFLQGQEPHVRVSAFTWPVVELVTLLGAFPALTFCLALAVLGSLLFLLSTALAPVRPVAGSAALALGFALILGAFGKGGELGAWLPGLLAGFAGRALGAVLGLAVCWLGWTLLFAARAPRPSSAETVQRLGLSARREAAAGVSPAEAALLVTEPRTSSATPVTRREEPKPIRVETIRPYVPPKPVASEPRVPRVEPLGSSSAAPAATRPLSEEQQLTLVTPPAPSWESAAPPSGAETTFGFDDEDEEPSVEERDEAEQDEPAEEPEPAPVDAARSEARSALTEDLAQEFELEEDEEEEDEPAEQVAGSAGAPAASWEQIGLFDEDEEEEEVAEPALRPAKVELTPTFDFEAAEPKKPAHEPEPSPGPFAGEPVAAARDEPRRAARTVRAHAELEEEPETETADEAEEPVELKPVRAAAPVPKASTPEPEPASVVAPDADAQSWHQLVYEAGLSILEQKRVAVSMLERRFAIDFDQACRVLDELQEAGLIGPYMGGRTRDILLTREQWLEHAPHAS